MNSLFWEPEGHLETIVTQCMVISSLQDEPKRKKPLRDTSESWAGLPWGVLHGSGGWLSAKNKLGEAYSIIPSIYNLANLDEFLSKVNSEL